MSEPSILYVPGYPDQGLGGVSRGFTQSRGGAGNAPLGYLHGKNLTYASPAASIQNWVYPSYKLTQGKDQTPNVFGHAISCWFRLNGTATIGSGYWYDHPVATVLNRSTSDPWIQIAVNTHPTTVASNRIRVGGNNKGATFSGADSPFAGSLGSWWLFGADGKTPNYGKWYFIMGAETSSVGSSSARCYVGDEDGNYAMFMKGTGAGCFFTDYNHTGQQVGLLGQPTSATNLAAAQRVNGDICQVHTYWWQTSTGGTDAPFSGEFFSGGKHLNHYNDIAALSAELRTNWAVRAYYPCNGDVNMDGQIPTTAHNLTMGTDGELRTAAITGHTDGPVLLPL